jgi:hypothetical protein
MWGERGEVKHLSTRRKRKQFSDSVSSGERKRIEPKPGVCDTCQGLRIRGCGTQWKDLTVLRRVTKLHVSRMVWESQP